MFTKRLRVREPGPMHGLSQKFQLTDQTQLIKTDKDVFRADGKTHL